MAVVSESVSTSSDWSTKCLADFGTDARVGANVSQRNFGQFSAQALFLINTKGVWVDGESATKIIVNKGVVAGIGRVGVGGRMAR